MKWLRSSDTKGRHDEDCSSVLVFSSSLTALTQRSYKSSYLSSASQPMAAALAFLNQNLLQNFSSNFTFNELSMRWNLWWCKWIRFVTKILVVYRFFYLNAFTIINCVSIEWAYAASFESTPNNIDEITSFSSLMSLDKKAGTLCFCTSAPLFSIRQLRIKFFHLCFNGKKKRYIEWLENMCCVRWKTAQDNLFFFTELAQMDWHMRDMTI